MSDFIRVMGLWRNTTREGKEMLTGYMGCAKIVILPNREKLDKKDHDFYLFICPAPPRDKKGGEAHEARDS